MHCGNTVEKGQNDAWLPALLLFLQCFQQYSSTVRVVISQDCAVNFNSKPCTCTYKTVGNTAFSPVPTLFSKMLLF